MSSDRDDLRSVLDALREQAAALLAAYDAAPAKVRRSVALVEYRCKSRRCELLTVWQSPGGRLVRLPAYKLSRGRTEAETVPAARAKNTTDNDRHWRARVIVLDEMVDWGPKIALDLNCDHVSDRVSVPDLVRDADLAKPGTPTRRFYPR